MIRQQQSAVHVDCNEFDSHEFPSVKELTLMLA